MTEYRLVLVRGDGVMFTWLEPPSITAIRQVMDMRGLEPHEVEIVKQTTTKYDFPSWYYQYNREVQSE